MYSNKNNHNKPPSRWLITLSQTLIIDSNTKSAIALSLSIDISLWYNNIQARENDDDDYQYQDWSRSLSCIGDSIGTINKIQTIVTIQQRALK